jgi:hypothetical protein
MDVIRDTVRESDNVHYYGTKTANAKDSRAANKVLQSAFTGEKVYLSAHEAAHIRSGGEWLASHKHDLPSGFVNSAAKLYDNVYDPSGRKVVDKRWFK